MFEYCVANSLKTYRHIIMVPLVGVEPTCLSALDFESSLYTNFNTVAVMKLLYYILIVKSRK